MAASDSVDWQQLLTQTQTLVTEGHHGYQRVQRDLGQLQRMAELQRARTSRMRTADNTLAATRLLVAQGLDTQRLLQDGQTLQLHATAEDARAKAQPADVAEFLAKVQQEALLAVISEQEEAASAEFERFMDAALEREWSADRHQMFAQIAPYSGGANGGPALLRGGTPAIGTISDKEQAYLQVVKKLNEAASVRQLQAVDAAKEFAEVCAKFEGPRASQPGGMVSCWQLVQSLLSEVGRGGSGRQDTLQLMQACLNGARKYLERGHEEYMRRLVGAHREVAQRGGDLDPLREVQAFLAAKLQGKGPLDFQQAGGHDTAWIQVFYCLRNGWHEAARNAAHAIPEGVARSGDLTLRRCLDEWLSTRTLSDRSVTTLARECDVLLRERAAVRAQPKYPYMVLLYCLLTSDMRALEQLQREVPGVFGNIEDFMWFRLAVAKPQGVGAGPSTSSGAPLPGYSVGDLQTEINRCNSSYYSKGGKEPLLYATVLLLTFQFRKVLDFLWKDEGCQAYRIDAVHLAITLQHAGVLGLASGEGTVAPSAMIEQFGRRFLKLDAEAALNYFLLAAAASGNDMQQKGRLLREVVTESPAIGTLLGGGGTMGSGGLLRVFEPSDAERRRLLEAVAHDCMRTAQTEHAVELFMAAGCPGPALAAINTAISAKLQDAVRSGSTTLPDISTLLMKGKNAVDLVGGQQDPVAKKEVWTFSQLGIIREALAACLGSRHHEAVQELQQLTFLPAETRAVPAATQKVHDLPQAITSLLPEVLECAAISMQALVSSPGVVGLVALREQLAALRSYTNAIPYRVPRSVYERIVQASAAIMA